MADNAIYETYSVLNKVLLSLWLIRNRAKKSLTIFVLLLRSRWSKWKRTTDSWNFSLFEIFHWCFITIVLFYMMYQGLVLDKHGWKSYFKLSSSMKYEGNQRPKLAFFPVMTNKIYEECLLFLKKTLYIECNWHFLQNNIKLNISIGIIL